MPRQTLIDNHVVRQGDTIHAATANHWDGTRWSRYGEPDYWIVKLITEATLDLYDPIEGEEMRIPLNQLPLGRLRVLSVERPAALEEEEVTVADLYAAQRRLKERIYETTDTQAKFELERRYKAIKQRLDDLIDQLS